MTERKTVHGPGPETKGGGFRGGPRRWTGGGPLPARHIPWPEIFKHHISVVEGHLKMIDMVRKHTVEGSGNWRTIMGCVDRAKEMLQTSKHISRSFVPPPHQREQVPLGSSSASMYPGYSPADHEYGQAAEEFGRAAAEAKKKGVEINFGDLEYEIGQSKGSNRRTLEGIREALAAKGQASGSGSGSVTGQASDASASKKPKGDAATNGHSSQENTQDAAPEGENPYFVVDTNPTPVNLPGVPSPPAKRSATPPNSTEAKKHKKAKKKHDGEIPQAGDTGLRDISEEVEARMKEKEEKRRRKGEKKRKRESEGEPATTAAEAPTTPGEIEKPKKKKSKKSKDEAPADKTVSKKRSGEERGEVEDGEGKKKKKRKKSQETVEEA